MDPGIWSKGTVCCVVRTRRSAQLFAVTCQHVLGFTYMFFPNRPPNVTVCPEGDPASVIGTPSAIFGSIKWSPDLSFDAAFLSIKDPAALLPCRPRPAPAFVLQPDQTLPTVLKLLTCRGIVTALLRNQFYHQPLAYEGPDRTAPNGTIWVRHEDLFEVQTESILEKGDSGTPALNAKLDTLIGMVLWRDDNSAYLLPAYALLDAAHYPALAPGDAFTLVP
jgi:hypothetical protein